ncbi:discoidin domain-containing protein [Microbacterium sulfonylureivorans]|uniref:discoidin domain-containing protein n=1 Tax=Microbacterium sulfonylureivorans TaxID=2486854 RepID=UPI0013DEE79D|nr:discoidin domain-containing protein [Microbacterium sulfonylureivorans]
MRSPFVNGAAAGAVVAVVLGSAIVAVTPAAAAPLVVQTTLWAAPGGSGSTCSQASPCSLVGARDKVRDLNDDMTGDIVVNLTDGRYELEEPLVLEENATTHDSGTNGFNVIYRNAPNATPVLSGGEVVSGFTEVEDDDEAVDIYQASVSEGLNSRQLYVDGIRATRARSTGNPGFAATTTGYTVPATGFYADMDEWGNQSDIEVAAARSWKRARYSVDTIDGTVMTMDNPGWADGATQPEYAARAMTWIENAYELLDTPGEWYLDRGTDTLFYIPLPDEAPDESTFILGRSEQLIRAAGTSATPLHHVRFEGLTFSHDNWVEPSSATGYPDFQGGAVYRGPGTWDDNNYLTPAGVDFRYVQDVVVQDNIFEHMSNAALAFGAGSQYNLIDGNEFRDISGNGINLGGITKADHHPTDPAAIVKNNTVSNNELTTVGAEYQDNPAIFVGYTQGSRIAHNTISDVPYTGISMGWGWGYIDQLGTSVAKQNVIQGNLIYDIMKSVHDGGAIYTLGSQPGSKVVDNYAYADHFPYGFLYRDNGSAGFLDSNNVISNEDSGTDRWYFVNMTAGGYWNPKNNHAEGNFYSSGLSAVGTGGSNTLGTNTSVASFAWPAPALAVIDEAGVGGVDITPTTAGEVPLSRGKAAVASSTYSAAYSADKAVDGNPATRWAQASGAADPSSLTVDLGEPFVIASTATSYYFHLGKGVKYKIEYSTDNATWSTYVDKTAKFSVPGRDTAAGEVVARYMRITFTATQAQGGSIFEFDVFGWPVPPVSQGKSATASSTYSAAFDASKAVDADAASRWAQASGAADPSWLKVDLGANHTISKTETTAYLHSGLGVKYKIEYSTDNTTWTTFVDRTSAFSTPGTDTPASPVTARYVRITLTATQGQGGSVYDFKVWE